MHGQAVLRVENLTTHFYNRYGVVKAVNEVSFTLGEGQTLGLVGESGCGKTVTALSLLGLIDTPGKICSGEVWLDDRNMLELSPKERRQSRGKDISMVFQDAMISLNPVLTIGTQVSETIRGHEKVSRRAARQRGLELLGRVGLPEPQRIWSHYPFQLSGGMRQRVMIAIALCLHPRVLIADEPTTALDLTIQAQILSELRRLKREFGTAILLITHDLGVIAEMADEVAVMYGGSLVEKGPVRKLLVNPRHPYTNALLNSVPRREGRSKPLQVIRGQPPGLLNLPDQCAFLARCPRANGLCLGKKPALQCIAPDHLVACYQSQNEDEEGCRHEAFASAGPGQVLPPA